MALVIAVLVAFVATTAGAQFQSEAVRGAQWAAFTGDMPRDWHGLWIRYGPSAAIVGETRASRAFKLADRGREIRQKVIYADPEFQGATMRNFTYRRETLLAGLVIVKDGNSFLSITTPDTPVFIFEMFFMHPRDNSVRFSLVSVFRGGTLNRTSLIREVDVLRNPAGHFWKFGRNATTAMNWPPVKMRIDRFRGTEKYYTPDYRASVRPIDWTFWSLEGFLGIDDSMAGLSLPDGIRFWYPKSLANAAKRRLTFTALWQVDRNTYVASKAVFVNGLFTRRYTVALYH